MIIDGGKGLQAAVKKAFRKRALIQRCQWHKRENVVSYLSKGEQASWRKRLQWAYNRPEYEEALTALEQLHGELEERNQSAAGSLEEGLEETLTLHRLGVHAVLGRSFKTTNCLESVNALVEERCAKVDHWKNSSQRQRWLATALVDIEPRLRKVVGYRPSSQASRSSQAGTEDRGEDINRIEEEGRLNVSRGEFQLRMGLTPGLATSGLRLSLSIAGTKGSENVVWVTPAVAAGTLPPEPSIGFISLLLAWSASAEAAASIAMSESSHRSDAMR